MNITIHRDGQNYGPYTLEQVKEYLGNGTLNETDLAWHDDSTGWLPLKEVLSTLTVSPSAPRLPQPQAVMVPLTTAHNPTAPEASQPRVDTLVKQSGTKLRLTGKIVAGIIGVVVIIIAFVHLSHRPSLTTNELLTNPLFNANMDSPTNSPISRPNEQIANVPDSKDNSSAIASPSVLSQTNETSTTKPEIAQLKTTVLETKDFTDIDSHKTIRFTRLEIGNEIQWKISYNGGDCTLERANMERFGKALQTFLELNSKNDGKGSPNGVIDSFTVLSKDNKTTTIMIQYMREVYTYLDININHEDSGNSSISFHADYVQDMQAYVAYQLTGVKAADKPWPGQGLVDFLRKDCLPDPFGVPVVHVSKPTQAILSHSIAAEPTGELIPYLLPLATKKDDKAFLACFLNWTPGDPARVDKFRDDIPQDDRFWEKAVNALDLWLEHSYSSPVILHGLDPRMFHLNHDMGYVLDGSAPLVVAVNVRSAPRHVGFHDVIPSRSITYPMAEKFVTVTLLASDTGPTFLTCSDFTLTNTNEWAIMWEPGQNDLYLYTISQKQSRPFLDSILRLTDSFKKEEADQADEMTNIVQNMMVQGPGFKPTPEIMVEVKKKVDAYVAKIRAETDQLKNALGSQIQGDCALATPAPPMVRDNEDETPPESGTIRWRIADLPDGLMGRKIIYSHGQFIAVGRAANPARDDESYSGAIVTSGDGINWTWRNVDIDNGNPVWMVRRVGSTQTEEPLVSEGTNTFFRDPEMFIDNPDGLYLYDGIKIFTSKDGTNWQVTHSFALPLFDSNYKAVRYNDELLYPQEWSIQSFDATGKRSPLSFDVRGQMDPPVVSPHLLVAIGKSEDPTGKIPACPAMFTSSDAHLWTAHPEAFRDISPISYLTYGLGSFWVFNNMNDRPTSDTTGIYKSIDGIVWNKISSEVLGYGIVGSVEVPGGFLVADDRGDLLFTRDGVTWQKRLMGNHAPPVGITGLAASSTRVVAMGVKDIVSFPISWLNNTDSMNSPSVSPTK